LLAAPFVSGIAKRFQARVTVISIVPPVWDVPKTGVPAIVSEHPQQFEIDLRSQLDAALTAVNVSVHRITSSGDPALKITEFAHDYAVDLIMAPTHGAGLFRTLLLGSVTAKILHDVQCPVWTATHAEEQHSTPEPKTILCAVDGTPKTTELLQWAAEFSQRMGAALKLLHVVQPITDWAELPGERDLQEEVREEARVKINALKQSTGVDLPVRIAVGPVVNTVVEEAREERADLIVIGRGTLQSTLGRLRTHSYGIIQKAPCPVLSV
jgi:nucleotide-binding universal stress UspA family protein